LTSDIANTPPNGPAQPWPNGARVPTLCRLACRAFEWFLADQSLDPRLPGQIPRAVIGPWWFAILALCGPELERFEQRLKTIVGTGEFGDTDQLAEELQKCVHAWTERVLAEIDNPAGDRALKAAFRDQLLLADVREIARILPIAAPLRAQISLAFSLLAEEGQMEGCRILQLSIDTVTMLKNQYLAFSDVVGAGARYFALALVNRMVQPWQILLVARSLAWRPDEQGSSHPEFDQVALRLVLDQQRAARDIAATAAAEGDFARVAARLYAQTVRYLDDAEGIASGLGAGYLARTEAPWNEIRRSADGRLAAVFDRAFLNRIAAVVLGANAIPDGAPDFEFRIEAATSAARLLALLLDHGGQYGWEGAARDCLETLAQAVEDQTQRLLTSLRERPDGRGDKVVAMLRVTETLFKDGPGARLARSLRMARQSSAA
jgi:hypothetical protein